MGPHLSTLYGWLKKAPFPFSRSFWSFSRAAVLIILVLKLVPFLEVWGSRTYLPVFPRLWPPSFSSSYSHLSYCVTSQSHWHFLGSLPWKIMVSTITHRSPEVLLLWSFIYCLWVQTDTGTQTASSFAFPMSAWKYQVIQPIEVKEFMSHRAEFDQREKRTRHTKMNFTSHMSFLSSKTIQTFSTHPQDSCCFCLCLLHLLVPFCCSGVLETGRFQATVQAMLKIHSYWPCCMHFGYKPCLEPGEEVNLFFCSLQPSVPNNLLS